MSCPAAGLTEGLPGFFQGFNPGDFDFYSNWVSFFVVWVFIGLSRFLNCFAGSAKRSRGKDRCRRRLFIRTVALFSKWQELDDAIMSWERSSPSLL